MNKLNATYLFYDIETTGLNKCFDQVLQFAAIRTDLELNELDRHFIHIRLNHDVIPSPSAIITHRISMEEIESGQPEIEAIHEIHRLMNMPGTISCGYNSLGFDDEFLRFSFYRNLLPPYTHQFANQCRRMDLYPITVMFYLFKHDAIDWPTRDGKITMKLEYLSETNQLSEGRAHNAMVDVEATLSLARKFIRHKNLWGYACGYFDKNEDVQRSQQLPISFATEQMTFREAVLINGNLGATSYYQAPVLSLGQHQHYKNQSLWLRLDNELLQTTTADTIAETTYVIRKRAGEQPILLPPLERFLIHLTPERRELATANKLWLRNNPDILQLICDYHQQYCYPKVENVDPDAALYELNFPTAREEFLFQRFHLAKPEDKEKVALQFPNSIRQEQAIRILGRHFPHVLSEELMQEFTEYCEETPSDYRGQKRLTPELALQEIGSLKSQSNLDNEQHKLLEGLQSYILNNHTSEAKCN